MSVIGAFGGIIWIFALVELLLLVWALVDLARRDSSEIMFNVKWPWVLIIVFIGTIGPLLYLLIGRRYA